MRTRETRGSDKSTYISAGVKSPKSSNGLSRSVNISASISGQSEHAGCSRAHPHRKTAWPFLEKRHDPQSFRTFRLVVSQAYHEIAQQPTKRDFFGAGSNHRLTWTVKVPAIAHVKHRPLPRTSRGHLVIPAYPHDGQQYPSSITTMILCKLFRTELLITHHVGVFAR